MDDRIPLTSEDIAILELESDTVAGHTCKLIRIAAPGLALGELRKAVGERMENVPELTRRLVDDPAHPAWVPDPGFRLSHHLGLYANGHAVSEPELREVTAQIFTEKLDRTYPLWRIEMVNLEDGGTALIWRIHHVLADGTTAMRMARQLLWDEGHDELTAGRQISGRAKAGRPAKPVDAAEREHERRRRHILGLFEREFVRDPEPSPFDGQIGHRRSICFATVSLQSLHDSARAAAGATVNDAVLDVVAGALRHWLELQHIDSPDQLTVKVPVSLHHGEDDAANRDSYFTVPLRLGEPDTATRLVAIAEATSERKQDHDAEDLDRLMRRVSHTSKRLAHLLGRIESSPRRFALSVSNVKGPKSDVSMGGQAVTGVHSIVEIGEHHALRIAVVSVGDRLCFGFCADPELIHDLDALAEGAEEEAARIVALEPGPH